MSRNNKLRQAAKFLFEAHQNKEVFLQLPQHLSPNDIEEAYNIQNFYHELISPDNANKIGYKIALTSETMQQMVGFGHPCSGALFSKGVFTSPASVNSSDYVRLGAECEIAVILGEDIPATRVPYDQKSITKFIRSLYPALELIEDRGADYSNLYFMDVIADNTWNAGIVLGLECTNPTQLELISSVGQMSINGNVIDQGTGGDVLGHPFKALAWLANHLIERDKPLLEGMIIMTGSIVKTKFLNKGDQVKYDFEGLGRVHMSVY